MRNIEILILGLISIVLVFTSACSEQQTYQQLVQTALETEEKKDSLFLGYTFGMPKEEFRDYSWQLNQQGLLTGFTDINYEIDFLKSKATMTFYPEFLNDRIVRIPVTVGYNAWAPWNEEYWPEALVEDLKEYYNREYDAEFVNVYIPEIDKSADVSIDANREIRIYKNSESTVMVEFIDLHNVETLSSED